MNLVVDFSEAERVCPSTAGFLVDLSRRLKKQGGGLKLKNVSERIRQVLSLLGVWDRFDVLEPVGALRRAS